jgi:hypothetical protein
MRYVTVPHPPTRVLVHGSATRVLVSREVAEALMDGSLRLLVVEDAGYNWSYPPPAIDRAIEVGERIGIDVECETCEGRGVIKHHIVRPGVVSVRYADPCTACTDGRVRVGSMRPVKVLPIYESSSEPHPHWVDRCVVVFPDGVLFESGIDAPESATNATDALSVYGSAESLVGKFAVEVEDARREP